MSLLHGQRTYLLNQVKKYVWYFKNGEKLECGKIIDVEREKRSGIIFYTISCLSGVYKLRREEFDLWEKAKKW